MRVSRNISLEELGEILTVAKERLSDEKKDILKRDHLKHGVAREEYAFAYLRAERIGMLAIHARLAEIAWLPMQLDPQSELVAENRGALKRWLAASDHAYPGVDDFGNDFIHALTRAGLRFGWDDPVIGKLTKRIAALFHDLSCLIGVIYFTDWLAERQIEGIALSDPEDLYRSVIEITAIVQSPELRRALQVRDEEMKKAKARKALEKPSGKAKPLLRLILNEDYHEQGFGADSAPV
jgi:hypothetical protein